MPENLSEEMVSVSRSGYSDDCEGWALIRWRGAVASSIRGRRGQAFLRELIAALDALPEKRLIENEFAKDGEFCALGAVGKARGLDMGNLDPEVREDVGKFFGIPEALAAEIMFVNDDWLWYREATPEKRFETVRKWAADHIQQQTVVIEKREVGVDGRE